MGRATTANLASLLEKRLSPQRLALLRRAGEAAHGSGLPLFLVGGPVRDLLLASPVLDLDLVVEGDAPFLASLLVQGSGGRVVAHSQFGTAKLKIKGLTIDLATARRESYARPGALPTVFPGSIEDDLSRRDLSINAMAVELSPPTWGDLWDPHGGRIDTEAGLIRVLHRKSFQDDATRILRALRYEQRLAFQIEEETLSLMRASLHYLDTIGGDRVRHELERTLQEDRAPEMLTRAQELGVLSAIYPALGRGRYISLRDVPLDGKEGKRGFLYLVLMAYCLEEKDLPPFISRLNMPNEWAKVTRDTVEIRGLSQELARADITPSQLYQRLKGRSVEALRVCALMADQPRVRERLELYLNELRYVKASLNGEHLLDMGVPRGPMIGRLLAELRRARLDGEIVNREQEEELVKGRIASLGGETSTKGGGDR